MAGITAPTFGSFLIFPLKKPVSQNFRECEATEHPAVNRAVPASVVCPTN